MAEISKHQTQIILDRLQIRSYPKIRSPKRESRSWYHCCIWPSLLFQTSSLYQLAKSISFGLAAVNNEAPDHYSLKKKIEALFLGCPSQLQQIQFYTKFSYQDVCYTSMLFIAVCVLDPLHSVSIRHDVRPFNGRSLFFYSDYQQV